MKKTKKIFVCLCVIIFAMIVYISIYVNDYYHAVNVTKYLRSTKTLKIKKEDYGISFKEYGNSKAFIFYPGAKVEYTAYSKIMRDFTENGIDCYLLKMPFNIAFLGSNKADSVLLNTKYKDYYVGGHSLGGVVAANYAFNNSDKINGLILLGSYSTKNLNNKNIKVLSIYGSNDKVLNKNSYNDNIKKFDKNLVEIVIQGGNHSAYASYGNQKGDGKLNIKHNKQINITVKEIKKFINN